jgi:hypothetical protein
MTLVRCLREARFAVDAAGDDLSAMETLIYPSKASFPADRAVEVDAEGFDLKWR